MSYSNLNPAWDRMQKGKYDNRVQWEGEYAGFLQQSSPGLKRDDALRMAALDYDLAHRPIPGGPVRYLLGDKVRITEESFQRILHGNRSIHHHPGDSYVEKARAIQQKGLEGEVTMIFPPGYEVNVTFSDGTILQMKDHWFEPVSVSPLAEESPSP